MLLRVRHIVLALSLAFMLNARAEMLREFIWTEAPFPRAHASTIVETAQGELIAAWFGGSGEGNEDVGVWSARKPGGGKWSPPEQLYKEPGQPAWNPVLFRDSADRIWLWFKVGPSPQTWSGGYMISEDHGRTWSDVAWLPAGLLGPVRNKPIILQNGNILAGTSVESYRAWASWMELSRDGGQSWVRVGPLVFPDMEQNRRGTIQPTLMEVSPGVIKAFFRTRGMRKVATATSTDGGLTWSYLTLTELDHPGAGVDSVRLRDGRCLLVYNPSTRGRTPLSVAVSFDGADTWHEFFELERLEEGQRGELSYPNVIQAAGGNVHVVYTWNRRRIRHVEIPLEDIPNTIAEIDAR